MRLSVVRRGLSTGKRSHPLYWVWRGIQSRCHDPANPGFANYGGRGISVCHRWRASFADFVSDMGERPAGRHIDRIDVNGNYEPGNCRWVTRLENNRNRRNTPQVMHGGKMVPLPALAQQFNISVDTLHRRLDLGWSVERAISKPCARGYHVTPCGRRRA